MPAYKFRVLIDTTSEQDIFRDIAVNSTTDFEVFYRAIVASFDFIGDQMASFYESNDQWDKGHEITLMDMGIENTSDSPSLMRNTTIEDIITDKGEKLILVYDFLKLWCFLIELVEILPENYAEPELLLAIGTAPDENSREMDLGSPLGMEEGMGLGSDIDDIFGEFDEDDQDDFGGFENIDDFDI